MSQRLAPISFTARKLPQAGENPFTRPLSQQNFSTFPDNR
jgi:hypothetical protein